MIQKLPSNWECSPLDEEDLIHFKGIMDSDTLLHFLKYPDHPHAKLPIWAGLPKRIRAELTSHKTGQVSGWGFQVEHKWNSMVFITMTCPIVIVGIVVAVTLTVALKWPLSVGITLTLLPEIGRAHV